MSEGTTPPPDGTIIGFPADFMVRPWPVLAQEAYYGLAGEVVERIIPQTEADRANLLTGFLVAFGNACGATLHAMADGHKHRLNLFVMQVGESGVGRKGSGWRQILRLMEHVDPVWCGESLGSGLSSGEGLIQAIQRRETAEDGTDAEGTLCVVEEEFGGVLQRMKGDTNVLSVALRQLWDGPKLRTLTRNPLVAKRAYVSILGQITADDLEKYLAQTDAANGFANRFLWACVARSKELPEGGESVHYGTLIRQLHDALAFARGWDRPLARTPEARERWADLYSVLTNRQPGMIGVIAGRGEAQTLRLSLLYAALDRSPGVTTRHLEAAYAVWRYCEDSIRYVFGDALGDPVADAILQGLRDALPIGLSQTDISDLFNRHERSARLRRALHDLERARLATHRRVPTKGGPLTLWYATPPAGYTTPTQGRRS